MRRHGGQIGAAALLWGPEVGREEVETLARGLHQPLGQRVALSLRQCLGRHPPLLSHSLALQRATVLQSRCVRRSTGGSQVRGRSAACAFVLRRRRNAPRRRGTPRRRRTLLGFTLPCQAFPAPSGHHPACPRVCAPLGATARTIGRSAPGGRRAEYLTGWRSRGVLSWRRVPRRDGAARLLPAGRRVRMRGEAWTVDHPRRSGT